MMCPVCLKDVGTHSGGITMQHTDTASKICKMSGKPMFEWDEASTRDVVNNRSNGICEYCRRRRATDCHHRISVGVGGKWTPANILHMCRQDHSYFTDHPEEAYPLGVMVKSHDERGEPHEIVVIQADGGGLWLTDDCAPPFPAWAR